MNMTLCNTAMPASEKDVSHHKLPYQSESPDEIALAITASQCGYKMISRTSHVISVEILDSKKDFEIIGIMPFNSDRKRMSIIVKDLNNGKILLFCKGADEVIYDRLARSKNVPGFLIF